jgi:hypothetical protein
LNPNVNANILKNRLWVIDHYRYRWGADHTYWVHTALKRMAVNANRYKFNYAAKGFLLYQGYTAYQNYRYVDQMSFMSNVERVSYQTPILAWGGVFMGACALF